MKKIVILALLISLYFQGFAQCYDTLYVENISQNEVFSYCEIDNNFLGVIIYGEPDCENPWFHVYGDGFMIDEENVEFITIDKELMSTSIATTLDYYGCNMNVTCHFWLLENNNLENPFEEPIIWKKQHESITLTAQPGNDEYLWSTGETTRVITVTSPGIYTVTQTNQCGSATYSVEVRDNVELYRATCDLVTNKNQVTWETTPEQAEYITAVKIYRNTTDLVATVPYQDGSFTDNIGSESTQWQYHLIGVSVEGNDCPIQSYWKRTIHLDRIQDYQGNMILQWTPYEEEGQSKETVTSYGIYDIVNGEAHHVTDVGNFTNVYNYNPADFSGYGAVAAIFSDEKGLEEYAFSNLTSMMLSVVENPTTMMVIYPNPSNGKFTIEGSTIITIYNTMGQMIATSQSEDGTHSLSLSSGIYFVKSGEGMIRKVVIE